MDPDICLFVLSILSKSLNKIVTSEREEIIAKNHVIEYWWISRNLCIPRSATCCRRAGILPLSQEEEPRSRLKMCCE